MSRRGIRHLGINWIAESNGKAAALVVGLGLALIASMIVALWTTATVPSARWAIVSAVVAAVGIAATTLREVRGGAARDRRRQAERVDLLRITTIGETVTEIAHGVNQPLTAIVNYAEGCLLQMKAGTLGTDTLVEVLDEIVAAGLRGGAIVRRLCGTLPSRSSRPEVVDVGDSVEDAVRVAEVTAERHGVSIRLKLGEERPAVCVDRLELELGVLGLIEAGIDAICETRLRRPEPLAETADGEMAIDQGRLPTGIAAPLFRTRADGLGLGMRISRSIVESLGGELWGAADEAGGAIFYLALPLEHMPQKRARDQVAEESAPTWRRPRVPVISVHVPAPAGAMALAWASDDGLLRSGQGAELGAESPKTGADATLEICTDG